MLYHYVEWLTDASNHTIFFNGQFVLSIAPVGIVRRCIHPTNIQSKMMNKTTIILCVRIPSFCFMLFFFTHLKSKAILIDGLQCIFLIRIVLISELNTVQPGLVRLVRLFNLEFFIKKRKNTRDDAQIQKALVNIMYYNVNFVHCQLLGDDSSLTLNRTEISFSRISVMYL